MNNTNSPIARLAFYEAKNVMKITRHKSNIQFLENPEEEYQARKQERNVSAPSYRRVAALAG